MNRKDFFKKGLRRYSTSLRKMQQISFPVFKKSLRKKLPLVNPLLKKQVKKYQKKTEFLLPQPIKPNRKRKIGNVQSPPGALSETEFLEKCTGCGNCIYACPYSVLFRFSTKPRKNIFLEWTSISTLVCFVKIGLASTRVRTKR